MLLRQPGLVMIFFLKSKQIKQNEMIFRVILRPDVEGGGYNVSCQALPGCHLYEIPLPVTPACYWPGSRSSK